jgi:hypothetical protein
VVVQTVKSAKSASLGVRALALALGGLIGGVANLALDHVGVFLHAVLMGGH